MENILALPNFGNFVLYSLLVIIGTLILYHFWFQSLHYARLGNALPGFKPLPIIGNALDVIQKTPTEIMALLLATVKLKGRILRIWLGSRLAVGLVDPRDIEIVLGSSEHLEKSGDYDLFEPWLGDGLLINKGDKWRTHRKLIAPTFHQSILKTFIPNFNKNAQELIKTLRKKGVGQTFDAHDYMSSTTVDVLLETVMGYKKIREDGTSFKYAKAVMDMCNILHLRHYKIWLRPNFIFKFTNLFKEQLKCLNIIHTLTAKVIDENTSDYIEKAKMDADTSSLINMAADNDKQNDEVAKEQENEKEEVLDRKKCNVGLSFGSAVRDDLDENDEIVGEKKRLPFLQTLIETHHTDGILEESEIRDEVNTILFEGHDTVASASSFFLCALGVHQDIQEKVYQELNQIFQGTNRPITFNDTLEMKYMERVLLETLRMYPPVPLITREIRQDIKLASADYIIPKNTTVAIGIYALHRDPKIYPNPDTFNPDNFLPEQCQKRHYYAFIPFSAGPRSCVGRKYAFLKLKVLLASLVRTFKIHSLDDEKDFILQSDIILKRADGFNIKLEERNPAEARI